MQRKWRFLSTSGAARRKRYPRRARRLSRPSPSAAQPRVSGRGCGIELAGAMRGPGWMRPSAGTEGLPCKEVINAWMARSSTFY
jgi:hypothetical protein